MPRIMVVDDEPLMREFCAMTVRNLLQADVEAFADVESALLRLRQKPTFDLLLIDYMMPGQDGLSLCREARRETLTRTVPIVVLTAARDQEGVLKAGGATAVLRKPLTPRGLVTALQPLLRGVGGKAIAPTPDDIQIEFRRSLPGQAEKLEQHLRDGDRKGVLQVTHRLRGTSGTFGVMDVADASGVIEDQLKADVDLAELHELALRLCALLRTRGAEA